MKARLFILILALVIIVAGVWVFVGETTDPLDDERTTEGDRKNRTASTGKEISDNRTFLADNRTERTERTAKGSGGSTNQETSDGVEVDGWKDPVNQRVLGPKKWMTKVSEEEAAKVQEVFAKAEARRDKRIDRISRQNSIDAMKAAVGSCLDDLRQVDPDATGRLIVGWTASASARGYGVIEDIEIQTNVGLRVESFEQCVLQADTLRFASQPGEPLRVEYPFMFDEYN